MVVGEALLRPIFGDASTADSMQLAARWTLYTVAVAGVLGAGWWSQKRAQAVLHDGN
jgi:hypothetical protein